MAPTSWRRFCSLCSKMPHFFFFLCFFTLFTVISSEGNAPRTYSRQQLMNIAAISPVFAKFISPELESIVRGRSEEHGGKDHKRSGREASIQGELGSPTNARRRRRRKRGKRGGLRVRLRKRPLKPPVPSLLLANVRSLENKMDELRARITSERETRNCCCFIIVETWLTDNIPDSAVSLETHTLFRADRTTSSGKKGGGGVCVYINDEWCKDVKAVQRHCSPDLEFLLLKCRPYYLPREFTTMLLGAVYIHPRANQERALEKLHDVISELETAQPDAVQIWAGDFNQCKLRSVLPRYYQHVDIPTRGKNILDHVYSNIKGALRASPRPPFGQSDHKSVFLYPAYRQRLKQSDPVTLQVKQWTTGKEQILQDCFATTDWDMFKTAATTQDGTINVENYAEYVSGYISTCVDNIVPTKRVKKFPNQKPWINNEVRNLLRARNTAFKTGNEEEYKVACYKLEKATRAAKKQHREKTEDFYSNMDPRRMWQCLDHITDRRTSARTSTTSSSDSLPDDLNVFYTRFESSISTPTANEHTHTLTNLPPPVITSAQVHKTLKNINPRKAAGPDNIPGRALRACADELTDVFTSIFNLSLSQRTVPTCYKTTTIVPLPKKNPPSCLNDYRPVALTPIIMKCFERVVLPHIQSSIPDTVDPLQFAYRRNRSTSDAIAAALHVSLTHLENEDSYTRILFIDYSSAFNTVVPHKLTHKLSGLGLHPSLCDWLQDFLTCRPQAVRIGNRTSASITTYTGTPQGCVLSPILYTLFTHDCVASHPDNIILKFADDTAVIGRITGGDESAYRKEVDGLVSWCGNNNLTLNTDKTKEMIVDMRRKRKRPHPPLFIRDEEVERVRSFKYLGVHISDDLTWTTNTTQVVKKAHQRLFYLRRLRKFGMSPKILSNFYSSVVESILTTCITVWYGSSTVKDRKRLQRVVKTASKITRTPQPSLQSTYEKRVRRRAASIIKDPTHPQHDLFSLLPSGRRYRSMKCRTNRLKSSFFPTAIRLLNS